jgi:tRNA A37 threonylcarbamoyladenosine modification protein TsaB
MTLFIDASDSEKTKLALIGGSSREHIFEGTRLSEILLPEIKKFLKREKTTLEKLETIVVVAGPGHFSRIRTAVATANALAYGLQIKIIGVKAGTKLTEQILKQKSQNVIQPLYDKEPNITMIKNI